MGRRHVTVSQLASDWLEDQDLSPEEWRTIRECLGSLASHPRTGYPLLFDGYPGGHRFVYCSHFLFIYQFNTREVRVKDVVLADKYDT